MGGFKYPFVFKSEVSDRWEEADRRGMVEWPKARSCLSDLLTERTGETDRERQTERN